jgi:hypothetical protein
MKIEKWQAKSITESLFKPTNYLYRLRARMEAIGFPRDHELYLRVQAAYDAMQRLGM